VTEVSRVGGVDSRNSGQLNGSFSRQSRWRTQEPGGCRAFRRTWVRVRTGVGHSECSLSGSSLLRRARGRKMACVVWRFLHLAELTAGNRLQIPRPRPGRRWKAARAPRPACHPPRAVEADGLRAGLFRTSSRKKRPVSLAREALHAGLDPSCAFEPGTAHPPGGMDASSI
jgi:hypothetical protein